MSETRILEYLRGYHFDYASLDQAYAAEPEKTIERIYDASYHVSESFTREIIEFLIGRLKASPGRVFSILHNIASKESARAPEMIDLFQKHFARFPGEALNSAYYICVNDPGLVRPSLVRLLREHVTADPCRAFICFQALLVKRPELVDREVVETVVRNLEGQVNQAFYFIREAVKQRPEFTPLCTVALFECVLRAPQAWLKQEMLQDILSIASHSHVKTDLERALREPPSVGAKSGRILMAILFRQKFRVRQRVLLEALQHAAAWTPIWEFLLFLLDSAAPKSISSAAAEDFLEAAYRLNLLVSPYEYQNLLVKKLDLSDASTLTFPEEVAFLANEPELTELYRKVWRLASNLGQDLRLTPIREFRDRLKAAERERQGIARVRGEATTRRRRKLETRDKSLEARLRLWSSPDFLQALRDPVVDPKLAADLKKEVRLTRRELAKKVKDALQAESVRISMAAIRAASREAYRAAVKNVLGREVDVSKVDPGILPSFMYFERLGRMQNNRRYLARLIEDRLEGRSHDWLRTEAPAVAWAERVKAAQPGILFERWRAPFSKSYSYRPKASANEKRRRIREDLTQTRALFARLKIDGLESAGYEELRQKLLEIRATPPQDSDPRIIEEIGVNLERVRIAEQTADSDYEGTLELCVETDPFQYLFMGEYGFASCLSIGGPNVWSAVSNAIDIDKVVIWAKEPGGNIVGRRLIALTPSGVLSYRTYANQFGLGLDAMFDQFIGEYAAACGTKVTHGEHPGPLLSDAWYDDGAL